MLMAQLDGRGGIGLALMLAAAALYVACRSAIDVLARADGSDPGRRALAQWLPIAATVLTAIVMRQPQIAVTLIFATSVAALSLALGFTTYLAPMQKLPPRPRAWLFLLPMAMLTFVAGFTGQFTTMHAVMLLLVGLAILGVWRERSFADPADTAPPDETPEWNGAGILQLILAIGLAAIGAWGAVRGTVNVTSYSSSLTTSMIAASILSPLLVLPMIGTSASVAQRDDSGPAATALVGTVVLNLCLLLPAAILFNEVVLNVVAFHERFAQPTPPAFSIRSFPLMFPVSVWRVENVMLLILGLLYLPLAFGRWLLGRGESGLLIVGYAIYLGMIVIASKMP